MKADIIREALRTDILAHGVPSATLGAFEDIIIQECVGRVIKFIHAFGCDVHYFDAHGNDLDSLDEDIYSFILNKGVI